MYPPNRAPSIRSPDANHPPLLWRQHTNRQFISLPEFLPSLPWFASVKNPLPSRICSCNPRKCLISRIFTPNIFFFPIPLTPSRPSAALTGPLSGFMRVKAGASTRLNPDKAAYCRITSPLNFLGATLLRLAGVLPWLWSAVVSVLRPAAARSNALFSSNL